LTSYLACFSKAGWGWRATKSINLQARALSASGSVIARGCNCRRFAGAQEVLFGLASVDQHHHSVWGDTVISSLQQCIPESREYQQTYLGRNLRLAVNVRSKHSFANVAHCERVTACRQTLQGLPSCLQLTGALMERVVWRRRKFRRRTTRLSEFQHGHWRTVVRRATAGQFTCGWRSPPLDSKPQVNISNTYKAGCPLCLGELQTAGQAHQSRIYRATLHHLT
jgi:hypothetical protein